MSTYRKKEKFLANTGYVNKTTEDIRELFKQVLRDRPRDFESLSNIGNCYLSLGRAKRLELQKARAKELSVHQVKTLRNTALRNYSEAIPFFERAVSIRSENPVVWKNLSVAYLVIGEKDKGSAAFQRAESLQGLPMN